jgi:formylglycine-generating enzyme
MNVTKSFSLNKDIVLEEIQLPKCARPLRLLWVEPGSFLMGSPPDELGRQGDEEQFRVIFSHGYWLGEFPLTQAQFAAFAKNCVPWPSLFSQLPDSDDRPVEMVTWKNAEAFCEELNKAFSQHLPNSYCFALPTEAQWEYACRAGTLTRYHFGDCDQDLDRVAWHSANSGGTTHPVGGKEPNPWGFYDMQGNVTQWCYDWYGHYPSGSHVDWSGPDQGRERCARGRSWKANVKYGGFRCASRLEINPSETFPWLGLRVSLRRLETCQ